MSVVRTMLTTALAALALVGLTPVDDASAARHCGLTRRVVTSFLRDGTVARPWVCARGHGSSSFAASCARGERVLVRVYAPT